MSPDRRKPTLLAFLTLASCAGAAPDPAPPRPAEGSPAVVAEPAPPRPAEPPPAAPLPDEVPSPSKIACTLRSKSLPHPAGLRIRDDGPLFARVSAAAATLEIAAGPPGRSVLRVEKHGVTLRGLTASGQPAGGIELFPAEPILFEGVAVAKGTAKLAWEQGREGELTVTTRLGSPVEGRPVLRSRAACDKVRLDSASFDARAALPLGNPKREAELRQGRSIPLSRAPGEPAALTLHVPEPRKDDTAGIPVLLLGPPVEVHAARGAHTQVVISTSGALVFGWVPSKDLAPPRKDLPVGWGLGGLGMGGLGARAKKGDKLLSCAHPLPLLGSVGGETARIGEAAAGVKLEVLGEAEDRTIVRVPHAWGPGWQMSWLSLASGAEISVPRAHTRGCAVETAAAEEASPTGRP